MLEGRSVRSDQRGLRPGPRDGVNNAKNRALPAAVSQKARALPERSVQSHDVDFANPLIANGPPAIRNRVRPRLYSRGQSPTMAS